MKMSSECNANMSKYVKIKNIKVLELLLFSLSVVFFMPVVIRNACLNGRLLQI